MDPELRDRANTAVGAVRRQAVYLTGRPQEYTPLLELMTGARFALLGEASHGTHEFYLERSEITKRLIQEKAFTAIAVEADWPDAYRVNRYVRGQSDDADAHSALSGFKRFPAWMWRNTVVRDFVDWLREYNNAQAPDEKVGFYGIDLYSLSTSMEAVLAYLDRVDPPAAQRARYRYSCFDHFGEDTQAYGYAAAFGLSKTCEDEVVKQLQELTQRAGEYAQRDGGTDADDVVLTRGRTRGSSRMPRSTTARCSAAAFPPGICATGTWWKPCRRWTPI
jgi:erythromycin esterase-like protein